MLREIPANYAKILVVNLMYIGDILFLTPAIEILRRNFPNCSLHALIDQANRDLLINNPNLDRLILFDKKGYHGQAKHFLEIIREIRREKYDLVINTHPNERASALAGFSGGKRRIGFSATVFNPLFSKTTIQRTDSHQVVAYLEILEQMRLETGGNHGLQMWIDEASETRAGQMWAQAGLAATDQVIGINTGGSWPTKRWTAEGFAALTDLLHQHGKKAAFFGGAMDLTMVERIIALTHMAPAVFTGQLTLQELAAMAKRCAVFVSGDTGPMHIAASQRVPVVALFGPSDPVRYAPYGTPHLVIRVEEACQPCGKHECSHHSCMQKLTARRVFEAVSEMLSTSSGNGPR